MVNASEALVCLEKHASWPFLDIVCDHLEILLTLLQHLSLSLFFLKIIYLIFISDVCWCFA